MVDEPKQSAASDQIEAARRLDEATERLVNLDPVVREATQEVRRVGEEMRTTLDQQFGNIRREFTGLQKTVGTCIGTLKVQQEEAGKRYAEELEGIRLEANAATERLRTEVGAQISKAEGQIKISLGEAETRLQTDLDQAKYDIRQKFNNGIRRLRNKLTYLDTKIKEASDAEIRNTRRIRTVRHFLYFASAVALFAAGVAVTDLVTKGKRKYDESVQNQQIAQLRGEVASLRTDYSNLREENLELSCTTFCLEEQVGDLQKNQENYLRTIREKSEYIKKVELEKTQVQEDLETARNKKADTSGLEKKFSLLAGELAKTRRQLQDYQQIEKQTQQELETLREQLSYSTTTSSDNLSLRLDVDYDHPDLSEFRLEKKPKKDGVTVKDWRLIIPF